MFNIPEGIGGLAANRLAKTQWSRAPKVSETVGGALFAIDFDRVRSTSPKIIETALKVDTREAGRIARAATISTVRSYLDALHYATATTGELEIALERTPAPSGIEHVMFSLEPGRGAMLFSAQFLHFLWPVLSVLNAKQAHKFDVAILMRPTETGRAFMAKISTLGPSPVRVIDIDTPNAILDMMTTLRRNGVLICFCDFCYEDFSVLLSDLFGAPAITAAGLPTILAKMGTPFLPFSSRFENGIPTTRLYTQCPAPHDGDTDDKSQFIADQMNTSIEHLVRERPEDWLYWRGLGTRWATANALINASEIDG